jgi:hypothetical protein
VKETTIVFQEGSSSAGLAGLRNSAGRFALTQFKEGVAVVVMGRRAEWIDRECFSDQFDSLVRPVGLNRDNAQQVQWVKRLRPALQGLPAQGLRFLDVAPLVQVQCLPIPNATSPNSSH